jgi:hypothetical protein
MGFDRLHNPSDDLAVGRHMEVFVQIFGRLASLVESIGAARSDLGLDEMVSDNVDVDFDLRRSRLGCGGQLGAEQRRSPCGKVGSHHSSLFRGFLRSEFGQVRRCRPVPRPSALPLIAGILPHCRESPVGANSRLAAVQTCPLPRTWASGVYCINCQRGLPKPPGRALLLSLPADQWRALWIGVSNPL